MVFEFQYPVGYLEITDFDRNTGMLQGEISSHPTLVMIQAGFCSACTASKPDFQNLGNTATSFKVMTIQLDGKKDSEKAISSILDKIVPGVDTIPSYVLFIKEKKIPYQGVGRTTKDLENFVNQNLKQFKQY